MWELLRSWLAQLGRPNGPNELEGERRQLVATIVKDDDTERVAIYQRLDGAFEYELERIYVIDDIEKPISREYWAMYADSGLFDSADTATREAAAVAPWIALSAPR